MKYMIQTVLKPEDMEKCPLFQINQFNWGGDYRPIAYGQLAYLHEEGFLLKMTCEEANPVCNYHKNFEPVWMDSALEGFFSFDKNTNSYVNLEINSAGALVASFREVNTEHQDLTEEEVETLQCSASSDETSWTVELFIPLTLIQKYFQKNTFQPGDCIKMNFFKLAEGNETTHFASYAPIDYPTPNFHLPEFFAEGVLT